MPVKLAPKPVDFERREVSPSIQEINKLIVMVAQYKSSRKH